MTVHRFSRVAVIVTAILVSGFLPARAEDPAKSKVLTPVLQPFVESNSLAGAVVLVANKDKVLAVEAVGFADVEKKTPMTTDSLFWIASQTKPITATALMLLVDEGKVKIEDPVEKYIPEFKEIQFKGEKLKTPITIRQILSHTSGLPFKSAEEAPTLDKLTIKECVASYVKTPLTSEPGTKYLYSNAGINTAGRIIEVVSGLSYEDFLDKRLFGPLGMKDTTFWPSEEQVKRLAKVYKPSADKKGLEVSTIGALQYPLTDRKRQPMPGGGLFSTAADVAKFCQMLLNNGKVGDKQLLSEASVKALTTKQTPDSLKDSYGLGFSVGGGGFGHGGALSTNMNIDTKHGLVTVWLVQHAGFPGDGGKASGAFRKVAEEKFSDAK
ncbi:MAG: serine hydrolase [Planctomycetaceae bacterium]|nr:serine hydrolase [Planctomycetaceae bacterium]